MATAQADKAANTMQPFQLGRMDGINGCEAHTPQEAVARFPTWTALQLNAYLNGAEAGRMARKGDSA